MGKWALDRRARALVATLLGCALPALLPATAVAQDAAAAAPLPARLFYQWPSIDEARPSPDGRRLALHTSIGRPRASLVIFDLEQWKPLELAAGFDNVDVEDFHWVNDEWLVFSIGDRERAGADQDYAPGLFSVQLGSKGWRELIRPGWNQIMTTGSRLDRAALSPAHRLLHAGPGDGHEVIVGEWMVDGVGNLARVAAKRVDVRSGAARALAANAPEGTRQWLLDRAGTPRAVRTYFGGREAIHLRQADGGWRQVAEYPWLKPPFTLRWAETTGTIYVTAADPRSGDSQLKRLDPARPARRRPSRSSARPDSTSAVR